MVAIISVISGLSAPARDFEDAVTDENEAEGEWRAPMRDDMDDEDACGGADIGNGGKSLFKMAVGGRG